MLIIEDVVSEFVKEAGGEVVDELLKEVSSRPKNADYLFRSENIIVELKCLEKNLFEYKEYRNKVNNLYMKWIDQGLINSISAQSDMIRLPKECSEQLIRLARRTVQDRIRSADKQIKETKKYFKLADARGLLLFVNDGNYSLESNAMRYLIGKILHERGEDCSIEGFVYLTVNMFTRLPEHDRKWVVWAPAYKPGFDAKFADFVDSLGSMWAVFWAQKTGGGFVDIKPVYEDWLDRMKYVR